MYCNRNKKVIHFSQMCAAYNCLNKACIYKRNLLRCLCTSCRKQIELLNVVVNIIKTLHYERLFPTIRNQKKTHYTRQYSCYFLYLHDFLFFLKALYDQSRINIQLHTLKPKHTGKLGINKFMSSFNKSKEHWFSSSVQQHTDEN